MKYQVASLMLLTWMACASNSVSAAPLSDGVAAIVDEEVVTYSDIQSSVAETEKLLRQQYQDDELFIHLKEAKLNVLKVCIERLLIIHDFKRQGGLIPDDYIQERINDTVRNNFNNDRSKFEETLADRGVTLDEYKKDLVDHAIVDYMRSKCVVEKAQALKPSNVDERNKLAASIQKAWLDSLRQQAYIKNFCEEGTSSH